MECVCHVQQLQFASQPSKYIAIQSHFSPKTPIFPSREWESWCQKLNWHNQEKQGRVAHEIINIFKLPSLLPKKVQDIVLYSLWELFLCTSCVYFSFPVPLKRPIIFSLVRKQIKKKNVSWKLFCLESPSNIDRSSCPSLTTHAD